MPLIFATGFEDQRGDTFPRDGSIVSIAPAFYNGTAGNRTGSPGRGVMGRRNNAGNNNQLVLTWDATQFAGSVHEYHTFWFYAERLPPTGQCEILRCRSSNTTANYWWLRVYPDGSIDHFETDGLNVLGTSAAGVIQQGVWHKIQVHLKRNTITSQPLPNPPYDTNGEVQVYVDGVQIFNYAPSTSTFVGSIHNYAFPTRWITSELGHQRLDTGTNWPTWFFWDDWSIGDDQFYDTYSLSSTADGMGTGHTWYAAATPIAPMQVAQQLELGSLQAPNISTAVASQVFSVHMRRFRELGATGSTILTPRLVYRLSTGTWASIAIYINGVLAGTYASQGGNLTLFLYGITIAPDDDVEVRITKDATTTLRTIQSLSLLGDFFDAAPLDVSSDINVIVTSVVASNGLQEYVQLPFTPDILIVNRTTGNVASVVMNRRSLGQATFNGGTFTQSRQIPAITGSGVWICSDGATSNVVLASGATLDIIAIQDATERVFAQVYGAGFQGNFTGFTPLVPFAVDPLSVIVPEIMLAGSMAANSPDIIWTLTTDLHINNETTHLQANNPPVVTSGAILATRELMGRASLSPQLMGFGLSRDGFNSDILIGRTSYLGNGAVLARSIPVDGDPIFAMVIPVNTSGTGTRNSYYRTNSMTGFNSRTPSSTSLVTSGGIMAMDPGVVGVGAVANVTGVRYEVITLYQGFDPNIIDSNVTQVVLQAMLPDNSTCPEPADGEDFCSAIDDPVLFCNWEADGTRRWYAETDLDDPADYYGGWKDARILGVSEIRRSLSGTTHTLEVGSFSVTLADEDYAIRSILVSPEGRYWNNREIEVYAVTPDGRREQVEPRKLATGYIDAEPEYDPQGDAMSVRFRCRDRLGAAQGWTPFGQQMVPRRTLTQVTLPGIISGVVGQATPIPYGILNTEVVASGTLAIPSPVGNPIYGAYTDGSRWYTGYASMNEGPSMTVGGITLSLVAGGALPLGHPSDEYYVQVWPVAADGTIGDPEPYSPYDEAIVVSTGFQSVKVDWVAASGAASYLVYLGTFEPGIRFSQYIETTGLTATFDRGPGVGQPASYDNITVGARIAQPGQRWQYGVRSRASNARSLVSAVEHIGISSIQLPNGRFRPLLPAWEDVPAATSYELLRKTVGAASYDRQWNLPPQWLPTLDYRYGVDDLQDTDVTFVGAEPERQGGAVKCLYVGDEVLSDNVSWRRMLVAGCAVQEISGWYYDSGSGDIEINVGGDGTDFLIPSDLPTATWPTYFLNKYRDVVGTDGVSRRYTFIYAKGTKGDLLASGSATLSVNLRGVETLGTGNGELLTDLFDQFTHVLSNFILASGEGYTNGPWFDMPTMGEAGVCAINSESVTAIKEQRIEEFAILGVEGGLQGAGVMGAFGRQVTVTEEIKRWCTCGDFRVGVNRHWQIGVYALQGAGAVVAGEIPELTDELDIHQRTMKIQPRLGELFNVFPYRYRRNYLLDGWDADNLTRINEASIANWRVRQEREALELHYVRDPDIAEIVVSMYEFRSANYVPTYVSLEGSVCLLNSEYDVGKYVRMPHWRGIGISGWANRPLWILASTFNPETRRVRLDCMDVQFIAADGGEP